MVAICAKIEAEIAECPTKTSKISHRHRHDRTWTGSRHPRRLFIAGPRDLLHRRRKEVRAWTIHKVPPHRRRPG